MPEPFTLSAFAIAQLGGAALNVGCGLITNCMEPARSAMWDRVAGWWRDGKTPENHDMLKATHAAYVAAMGDMARATAALAFDEREQAAASALAALVKRDDFVTFRWDGEHLPLAETGAKIDSLFAGRHAGDPADEGWRRYNGIIVSDLAIWGIDLPERLATMFVEGLEGYPPWHICFRAQFAEAIKADNAKASGVRVFRILTFERLTELAAASAIVIDAVAAIDGKLDALRMGQDADRARDVDFQQRVMAMLAAKEEEAQARGVTDAALRALAERVAENVPDVAQALVELEKAIDDLIRLREAAASGTNLGDLINEVLRQMAAANEKGQLDEAAAMGARAFADWQEQQAAQQAAGLRLIEANIEQGRLGYDAEAMAQWICRRLALENRGALDMNRLLGEQGTWYESGLVRGNRLDLNVAIALAQSGLECAPGTRHRAIFLNRLAVALSQQGKRSGGDVGLTLMARAVEAFEAALDLYPREVAPFEWAAIQNNIGNALLEQGRRSVNEAGLALLARAVAAYEAALEVRIRDAMPIEWAMTHNNLGNALLQQARRSAEETAPALLVRGVAAYEAALEVRTREAMPIEWATTQANLANALLQQGRRSAGKAGLALLARAVAAYEDVLEVRTREAMPADWAGTQNNLGNALSAQGLLGGEADIALLTRAIAAYEAALEVRTRDAMPAAWASTQNNMGNTIRTLGLQRGPEEGMAMLTHATAIFEAALEVRTRHAMPSDWATTQKNLALVRLVQSEWTVGTTARSFAQAAQAACSAALSVYAPEHMPYDHGAATELLIKIEARIAKLDAAGEAAPPAA